MLRSEYEFYGWKGRNEARANQGRTGRVTGAPSGERRQVGGLTLIWVRSFDP